MLILFVYAQLLNAIHPCYLITQMTQRLYSELCKLAPTVTFHQLSKVHFSCIVAVGTYLKFLRAPNLYTVSWPCLGAQCLWLHMGSGSLQKTYVFRGSLGNFVGKEDSHLLDLVGTFREIHLRSTNCSVIYAPTFPTKHKQNSSGNSLKFMQFAHFIFASGEVNPIFAGFLILSSCRQLPWFRLEGRAFR